MPHAMLDFLRDLIAIPSPTGYSVEVLPFLQNAFAALAWEGLTLRATRKGGLMLHITGRHHDAPRGLTAHADTLGLMVREIKPNGSLRVVNLGGISFPGIEYENVTVRTHAGVRLRGTMLLSNPSTHANNEAATRERNAATMELRLDERVFSAEDTEALGVQPGDFVFVDPRWEVTASGFIKARFLDNKAGVAAIWEALRQMHAAGKRPAQDTHILISTYEEVGHGGAADWPPDLAEYVCIDMGVMGNGQNGDEYSVSLCLKDASGPYHFGLSNKLRDLASAAAIPLRPDTYLYYSSDGAAYWRAGGAAAVALIGPGVASSHGYERTHTESLQHTARLIARYLETD